MWALSVAVLTLFALVSPAAAADLELGKKVYAQRCATCHGPDGKGNAAMSSALKVEIKPLAASAGKPEAEVRKVVAEGKKPMPGFAKMLNAAEMDAVLAYTKDLAGK
jgi:mono/diheme cytochrome c family protein